MKEEEPQGTEACSCQSPPTPICRWNLKTHSAQSGCRGNPAQPMIRGEMESLPHQLLYSGRKKSSLPRGCCAGHDMQQCGPPASPFDLSPGWKVGVRRITTASASGRSPISLCVSPFFPPLCPSLSFSPNMLCRLAVACSWVLCLGALFVGGFPTDAHTP